jgi:hypothetical protein
LPSCLLGRVIGSGPIVVGYLARPPRGAKFIGGGPRAPAEALQSLNTVGTFGLTPVTHSRLRLDDGAPEGDQAASGSGATRWAAPAVAISRTEAATVLAESGKWRFRGSAEPLGREWFGAAPRGREVSNP